MSLADAFKRMFKGAYLEVEDLFLLESFQIGYLPGVVPERELAVVLHEHPAIKHYLVKRNPSVAGFIEGALAKYKPAGNQQELADCSDKLLWTIADLLIYHKCPEVYDSLDFHNWDFGEVIMIAPLDGKIVIDGGAGTGRVTLEVARTARHVFAVEPVARLRRFIREKALKDNMNNIFVIDGFLDTIPLPDGFADVLITSHALGWRLEAELSEFERVVRKGGWIIHCPGTAEVAREEDQHSRLISGVYNYQFSRYRESDGWKRKYWKQL
ncbi:MAG: class I SAM-dependent methyltransferase [Dehalococcoidales bacterium]|nr:MAG: class I SAM-dependent methyltransferase [Dehalococcoidales bacterium]